MRNTSHINIVSNQSSIVAYFSCFQAFLVINNAITSIHVPKSLLPSLTCSKFSRTVIIKPKDMNF